MFAGSSRPVHPVSSKCSSKLTHQLVSCSAGQWPSLLSCTVVAAVVVGPCRRERSMDCGCELDSPDSEQSCTEDLPAVDVDAVVVDVVVADDIGVVGVTCPS